MLVRDTRPTRCAVTGDERPDDGQTDETTTPTDGETAAGEARAAAPRYRPPAPYPPPAAYAPPSAPPPPANAVPGYVSPAGRVWAPPAAPSAPRPGTPGATPPPLHLLRPELEPRWSWQRSVCGLAVGFSPELLLALTAYAAGTAAASTEYDTMSVATAIVLLVSSVVFYGWQLFAAWLFSLRSTAHKLLALGFRRPTLAYFWTIPVVLLTSYVVIAVNDAMLHPPQQELVQAFPPTAAGIVLFALLAVLLAPIAEEVFFRGFIFRGMAESWGFLPGAAASAAVFSLAHLQLTLFVPLFTLGFGLAWAYRQTGSLWTSITIHATFNGVAVLAWALTS
jgi:uncharacterized protein